MCVSCARQPFFSFPYPDPQTTFCGADNRTRVFLKDLSRMHHDNSPPASTAPACRAGPVCARLFAIILPSCCRWPPPLAPFQHIPHSRATDRLACLDWTDLLRRQLIPVSTSLLELTLVLLSRPWNAISFHSSIGAGGFWDTKPPLVRPAAVAA